MLGNDFLFENYSSVLCKMSIRAKVQFISLDKGPNEFSEFGLLSLEDEQ